MRTNEGTLAFYQLRNNDLMATLHFLTDYRVQMEHRE